MKRAALGIIVMLLMSTVLEAQEMEWNTGPLPEWAIDIFLKAKSSSNAEKEVWVMPIAAAQMPKELLPFIVTAILDGESVISVWAMFDSILYWYVGEQEGDSEESYYTYKCYVIEDKRR